MKRRDFIAAVPALAAYAREASAAEPASRSLGWLTYTGGNDAALISDTMAGLQSLGWMRGTNLRLARRSPPTTEDIGPYAAELTAERPDLVVASGEAGSLAVAALAKAQPLLFYDTFDPVRAGLVQSLARPGGQATGFVSHPPSLAARWVQLLQEMVPGLGRIAVVLDPSIPSSGQMLGVIDTFAAGLGIAVTAWPAADRERVEDAMRAFPGGIPGAVIMVPDPVALRGRRELTQIAVQAKVPTMFWYRAAVTGSGLMSYGPDRTTLPSKLAAAIDLLLRGAAPAGIPVEEPVRYELVINRLVATTLGLTIPPALLARADEVIE